MDSIRQSKTKHIMQKHRFDEFSPALFLGLMLVSGGIYFIYWIYLRTKEFEILDSDYSPDANRGIVILMILPFLFFFISIVFEKIIFGEGVILMMFNYIGFSLIYFLILKYLFDFSHVFGRITKTHFILWFLLLVISSLGVVAIFMNWFYLKGLILVYFLSPLFMQIKLNEFYKYFKLKKERLDFYKA